jgi:methylated-DNA-[protein]-cysteine S-methyltransferase
MMTKAFFFDTSMGRFGVAERDGMLAYIFFGNTVKPSEYTLDKTPLLDRAIAQIEEHIAGARKAFDLPLQPIGTAFERTVWQALLLIPYGETRTYGQIAAQIGRPKASRAVGRAVGRNPLSIVIPCHRVIGQNGALTGYAGGIDMKRALLRIEGMADA